MLDGHEAQWLGAFGHVDQQLFAFPTHPLGGGQGFEEAVLLRHDIAVFAVAPHFGGATHDHLEL